MSTLKNAAVALAVAFAVAAAASPALANKRADSRAAHPGYNARAEAIEAGEIGISPARAAALRGCNTEASKFVQYTWGDFQSDQMRACMARSGQPE